MTRISPTLQWIVLAATAAALIGCPAGRQESSDTASSVPAASLTAEDAPAAPEASSEPAAPESPTAPTLDGAALYASAGCITCHGDDLAGKPRMGPPITGMSAHWTAAELEAYLADPREYKLGNPRLREMDYMVVMPPAPLNHADRTALAAWLLLQ